MMNIQPVILVTDAFIYLVLIVFATALVWVRKNAQIRASWSQIISRTSGLVTLIILLTFITIGVLDSIHFRSVLPQQNIDGKPQFTTNPQSVLDVLMSPINLHNEKTFSAPFALKLYDREPIMQDDGRVVYAYPALQYSGTDLTKLHRTQAQDITIRIAQALILAIGIWLILLAVIKFYLWFTRRLLWQDRVRRIVLITLGIIIILITVSMSLAQQYHILGTDKVGQDVFYLAIKSIRTGLVIGTLTTLVMLPFALFFGTLAGYFGGWVDDIIQYIYTTLSSIPGVLLIAASILSLQIFTTNHPGIFKSLAAQADLRLLALCMILGLTSWTSLCRILRGETLKLREMDYVQAAKALGVKHGQIILRHITPNVLHIILITVVLDFSGLVLAEAVLSYVGVGVDPTTISWGNMINSARLELAREPVVWWPLFAAFIFMFTLVLSANIFADIVRDAFDPRTRVG